MGKEFGGANGRIDYADGGMKKAKGDNRSSGSDVGRFGGTSKTKNIMTTDTGDNASYAGTVKDKTFNQVADASGWER